MVLIPDWLPLLVRLLEFDGNWDKYLKALYGFYKKDFVDGKPSFRGMRLGIKRHPVIQGREATFWHLISEGRIEDERLPDLRRCERIRWPRPIIESCDVRMVKVWENVRRGEKRICLWLEDHEYLVILAVRRGYVLLWTAYPVKESHRKAKLRKEYEGWRKANAAQ